MPAKKKVSDQQLEVIYNTYHGKEGHTKQTLTALADDYGVTKGALSHRLKNYTPDQPVESKVSIPEKPLEEANLIPEAHMELYKEYAHLLYKHAKLNRVTEMRLNNAGRWIIDLATNFVLYGPEIIKLLEKDKKLKQGTRGGYSLIQQE